MTTQEAFTPTVEGESRARRVRAIGWALLAVLFGIPFGIGAWAVGFWLMLFAVLGMSAFIVALIFAASLVMPS